MYSTDWQVDMRTGLKNPRVLLALIISLSIPIVSGYLLYCDLEDNDLFSQGAKYENMDIDDCFPVPDCQSQMKLFASIGSNVLLPGLLPEANAIEEVSPFWSLSSWLEQKPFVLRC
jgi:hypothetical protein